MNRPARKARPVAIRQRRPPLTKSLLESAVSHMHTAVEFFNRPTQPHRYEIAAELALAAWEKLLKAYLHRAKHNIFYPDGKTKDFNTCRNAVLALVQPTDTGFIATHANLELTYEYRNQSAHFYGQSMNAVLHGLFSECVAKFALFIRQHFDRELLPPGDLGVLPVGFGRPVIPQDFLSDHSASATAPAEVKQFLKALHDTGVRLHEAGVAPEYSMMVSFSVALEDAKKLKRADVVVGVNNAEPQAATLTVQKHVTLADTVRLTPSQNAPAVHLKDDKVWDIFNLTTKDVTTFMRQRLPQVTLNNDFWKVLKRLGADPNALRIRYLDPKKNSGAHKKMYSDVIYQLLIDEYEKE
ncbi:DUF3644 domain-containing protein [Hymenobacter defluvii]